LNGVRNADRVGGNPALLLNDGIQAAAHQDHHHLGRLNLVVSTCNTFATLLVLAVVLLQLLAAYRN
jgi:hypothetical protein